MLARLWRLLILPLLLIVMSCYSFIEINDSSNIIQIDTWTSVRRFGVKDRVNYAQVEELVRNKVLLCAFDENQVVVGAAEIQHINSEEAEIGLVSVDPARQSQGIGKLLLLQTIDKMKSMGYKVATMSILGERPELLAWYSKLGFQDTGERPLYRNPAVIDAVLPLTVVKKVLS